MAERTEYASIRLSIGTAGGGGGGAIEVSEVDGALDVTPVTHIRVPSGMLTDDGGGQVTIAIPAVTFGVDADITDSDFGDVADAGATGKVADAGHRHGREELPVAICIACSSEAGALPAGTGKVTFRMPFAMSVTEVRASLVTAQTSGSIFTVDINEAGTSILSTKLTIDNTEKTSTTAATPPVISDASLADDAEMSVDVDQIGDGTAKGLKVWIIGTKA